MSKTLHRNMQAKMDSMKGPEWDSSDDDDDEEEEKGKVVAQAKSTGNAKSASKSSKKNKVNTNKTTSEEHEMDATVLYIGHLPNEFEERDLKNLLQQFGKVLNIRISRSVKSGNSRGYAFARFQDAETTRIVAETLQGYFVGQRRLICHTVPNPRKSLFYDTDKIIERRKLRIQKAEQERRAQLNNLEKIKEITARLVQRERSMRSKFQKLGIDYDFPGYEACLKAGEEIKVKERKRAGSDDAESGEQKAHDESAKSDKDAKKRKVTVDGATTPSSASKKDTAPMSKQKETKLPLSSMDETPPASKHKETKASSSPKKETTPASKPKETKSPLSSKKMTTPASKHKETKSPSSSKKENTPTSIQQETKLPSSSKKDNTPAFKQKETKSPSSSKKDSTPASTQKETKSPLSSKKDSTPASTQKETKSPSSSKKDSTPASKQKETKSPLSSKKDSATPADKKTPPSATKETMTPVSQNKKSTPAKSDNDSKATTNESLTPSSTRVEQPMKRKHENITPTKVATDKLVAQSDVKTKKSKKKKKRRESAP